MTDAPADLPEAAERRFTDGAFTSGLTVPDFAACLQMGLEPVGYVQGFCVMQWQWYGMGSPFGTFGANYGRQRGYAESWQCPHGFVSAEHRGWGQNYEQSWIEDAWRQGFDSAAAPARAPARVRDGGRGFTLRTGPNPTRRSATS